MSWLGSPEVGEVVRARRDIAADTWERVQGRASIRRGRQGLVREVGGGILFPQLTVEFEDLFGTRLVRRVPTSAVTRGLLPMDSEGWRRRQDYRQGARIGLFLVFGLPALVALAGYMLGGGSIATLVPALIDEAVALLIASASGPFGLLLVPLALWVVLSRRWRR